MDDAAMWMLLQLTVMYLGFLLTVVALLPSDRERRERLTAHACQAAPQSTQP